MSQWRVELRLTSVAVVTVEADSADEALERGEASDPWDVTADAEVVSVNAEAVWPLEEEEAGEG